MPLWDLKSYRFGVTDSSATSSVSFVTHVEVAGDESAPLPQEAMMRLLSLYVVAHLKPDALKEACETLVDTYKWSMRPSFVPTATASKIAVKPKVNQIDRPHFEFEE